MPTELRGPPRADGSLECARVTDKALGEPQLSRPMARAALMPSKCMCALHVYRYPVARALAGNARLRLLRIAWQVVLHT